MRDQRDKETGSYNGLIAKPVIIFVDVERRKKKEDSLALMQAIS
jgi:hypothetical protein